MTFLPEERTIMRKRLCKHCSAEIYLQYIPVTPTLQWISFEASDGKLHSCPNRLLNFELKKLIQEAVDRMNYTKTNGSSKEEIVDNIDTIIDSLKNLRQDVIKLTVT